MNHSIESLADRIARLEDREAIKELKAQYLRACDLKQVDALRNTLHPDGAVIAYEGFPEFSNRDDFVAVFEQMACQDGVFDIHHATNAQIRFTGPNEALGKWSLHFKSIILAQNSVIEMGVEYEDQYVRRDERWWIAETRTTRPLCLVAQLSEGGNATYVAVGTPPEQYG